MKKRYLLVPVLVTGIIVGGMTLTKSDAYLDLDGINQQIERHDEQLNNHEVRIQNNSNDIEDIQNKTQTAPSSSNVTAPQVVTAAPEQKERSEVVNQPEPEPEPVVVTAFREIAIEGSENKDCEYTYSDGTTYTFHWKTVEYNQGTKITQTHGQCDASVIGRPKP